MVCGRGGILIGHGLGDTINDGKLTIEAVDLPFQSLSLLFARGFLKIALLRAVRLQ